MAKVEKKRKNKLKGKRKIKAHMCDARMWARLLAFEACALMKVEKREERLVERERNDEGWQSLLEYKARNVKLGNYAGVIRPNTCKLMEKQ